jgi:thioredoxin
MSLADLRALDGASFDARVTPARRPQLIDFWAPWCGQCRLLAPVVSGVAEELAGTLDVWTVDTESEPALAARLGVQSLPTLLLLVGGDERLRLSGPRSRATLLNELAPWAGGKEDVA